jgi:two-component system, NarL family, invasion response regulator UvrY
MSIEKQIFLVDDHTIVRDGLTALIQKLGDFKITGSFGNGNELLEAIRKGGNSDLIILDVSMPGLNGEEVLRELNKLGSSIPVLILTLGSDEEILIRLFRLGARGYLHKNCTAVVMKEALQEIFQKGLYHNDFLAQALRSNEKPVRPDPKDSILRMLTEREKEFLKLVFHEEEYTYEQIAHMMGVHRRTVDGYRESIFDKFGIKSKTGLVLYMVRNGLLEELQKN